MEACPDEMRKKVLPKEEMNVRSAFAFGPPHYAGCSGFRCPKSPGFKLRSLPTHQSLSHSGRILMLEVVWLF